MSEDPRAVLTLTLSPLAFNHPVFFVGIWMNGKKRNLDPEFCLDENEQREELNNWVRCLARQDVFDNMVYGRKMCKWKMCVNKWLKVVLGTGCWKAETDYMDENGEVHQTQGIIIDQLFEFSKLCIELGVEITHE